MLVTKCWDSLNLGLTFFPLLSAGLRHLKPTRGTDETHSNFKPVKFLKWREDCGDLKLPAGLIRAPIVQSAAAFANKGSDIGRDWVEALVRQCVSVRVCVCLHKLGLLQCCWLKFVTSAKVASLEDRLTKGGLFARLHGTVS